MIVQGSLCREIPLPQPGANSLRLISFFRDLVEKRASYLQT